MERKEMVREIYNLAEDAGFTVQQFDRKCLTLHPETTEQRRIALKIANKYNRVDYDKDGNVEHIYFSVNVK